MTQRPDSGINAFRLHRLTTYRSVGAVGMFGMSKSLSMPIRGGASVSSAAAMSKKSRCDRQMMECVRLWVCDVDFDYGQLIVRGGKGNRDRLVPLPDRLVVPLKQQLDKVAVMHNKDLSGGFGKVHLPYALARKYKNAARGLQMRLAFRRRSTVMH